MFVLKKNESVYYIGTLQYYIIILFKFYPAYVYMIGLVLCDFRIRKHNFESGFSLITRVVTLGRIRRISVFEYT